MSDPDNTRPPVVVGVIGTGMMGAPLLAAISTVFPTVAYDTDEARRDAAISDARCQGAAECQAARDISDVATCDIVVTMLPNSDIVDDAIVGSGLMGRLAEGAMVVDMGSSIPSRTRDLAARLEERGIGFVDAPVSGGVARARSRTLTVIAGGTADNLARARPVLETVAESIFHVGPVGSGHTAKALNNVASACGLLISVEAVEAAGRSGIDPGAMVAVLNASTGRNHATETKIAQYVISRRFDSGFATQLMLKDLRIAESIFVDTGISGGLAASVLSVWERLANRLPPDADQTEIARVIAEVPTP